MIAHLVERQIQAEEDKEQVITSASDISIPADQEILHRIPQYTLLGFLEYPALYRATQYNAMQTTTLHYIHIC